MHVAQVRSFNRLVGLRIGALDDRFLEGDRPLAEARLLWEIGTAGCEVRALRARLELDAGHASRLLRSLERDGLAAVKPDAADGRVRIARLTEAGLAERARLDERSDALARAVLEPLDEGQRDRLTAAMREVETLLTAAVVQLRPADPESPDARQCLRAYLAEIEARGDAPLDPATRTAAPASTLRPPHGLMLVAYLHEEAIGCGAVRHNPAGGPSEIKRMWVAPAARGLGVGRRLLAALEAEVTSASARLETSDNLPEAIALYRSAGYEDVPAFNAEPYADHWFEKRLRP